MAAMMQLHWSPKSPYVRKVMIAAGELNLLPALALLRSVAAMRQPNQRLMQHNPLSKIPTLVLDNGFTLFDSVVICDYLNDLADGPLFPRQGQPKWQALRWHALGDGMLDAAILWRNEREKQAALPALLDAFELKMRAALKQLDGETQALAEAPFSIGHIGIGCALGYLDYRFQALAWRGVAPGLAQWFEELAARPSFKSTEPVDG